MYTLFVNASRRYLILRPANVVLTSGASRATSVYDLRRQGPANEGGRAVLLPTRRLQPRLVLEENGQSRCASSFQIPSPTEVICKFIKLSKCIDMSYLKDTPPPVFWVVAAASTTQLAIPFLEIIGGFCPVLTYLQLHMAAMTLAFDGGKKWGLAVSSNPKPEPSWDTMTLSLIPPSVALVALSLPYPLGFMTMISGLITSLYLDLTSCIYPPGAVAASYLLNIASAFGLLLALIGYVVHHNRENHKKKQAAAAEEGDEDLEENDVKK